MEGCGSAGTRSGSQLATAALCGTSIHTRCALSTQIPNLLPVFSRTGRPPPRRAVKIPRRIGGVGSRRRGWAPLIGGR